MDPPRPESGDFDSDDESPDEILGEFLVDHSIGDEAAFEELVKRYPKQESQLRRLAEEIRRAFKPRNGETGPIPLPPRLVPLFARLRRADERDGQRFAAREEIGHGGMGVVLCVRDHALRRDLAKKSIRNDRRHGERAERTLERFIDEAQITAQLDHPGVVPVHDLGIDADGTPYFTMRRVRGEDLGKIFKKVATGKDGWSLTRAISALLRVCETMAYAHEKQVIHRDLKPENVMVGRFGEVYVMDWGLARTLGKPDPRDLRMDFAPRPTSQAITDLRDEGSPGEVLITADGAILGTPVYMPPEQAAGDTANLGMAADVYSVGAMLYELLAGHQPYVRPGTTASGRMVLRWILDGPPHALAQVAKNAPPELIAICDRAMARSPARRYPSMSAFADDVRAWLEGRVVSAHRSGAWAEFSAWVKRNRTTALVAATLIAVVIGASALSAWQYRRQVASERDAQAERSLRLDIRDADALIREAEELWPIHPDSIPHFDDWLLRAQEIVSRRSRGAAPPLVVPESSEADPRAVAERIKLRTLIDTLTEIESRLADPERNTAPFIPVESLHASKSASSEELTWRTERGTRDRLKARIVAVDSASRGGGDQALDIRRIQARVEYLADPHHGLILDVHTRRDRAATLAARSVHEHRDSWRRTTESISNSSALPSYSGTRIKPQLGLVPLGPDPESGLHEFWHVLSGTRPTRDTSGRLRIESETGLVFVLIPGGRHRIGAQGLDQDAPLFDEHARQDEFAWDVELAPFLISKYEMTLGQWVRVADSLPSEYHAGYPPRGQPTPNFAHPVESIAWYDVARNLARWNLDMPTEAQWEVAARAGRQSASSISLADPAALSTVNAYDPADGGSGGVLDGYGVHAPVDSFLPNPFGLYNTLGNVGEYCSDWFHPTHDPKWVSGDDCLVTPPFFELKCERGGSYATKPADLRFGYRDKTKPEIGRKWTGVRPRCRLSNVDHDQ